MSISSLFFLSLSLCNTARSIQAEWSRPIDFFLVTVFIASYKASLFEFCSGERWKSNLVAFGYPQKGRNSPFFASPEEQTFFSWGEIYLCRFADRSLLTNVFPCSSNYVTFCECLPLLLTINCSSNWVLITVIEIILNRPQNFWGLFIYLFCFHVLMDSSVISVWTVAEWMEIRRTQSIESLCWS